MNDVEIEKVHFTQDRLGFELKDGRLISVPLSFYPTLQHASEAQRLNFELYPSSVHWPDLDCDIGVEGMLSGAKELPVYAAKSSARRASESAGAAMLLKETPKTYPSKKAHRSSD